MYPSAAGGPDSGTVPGATSICNLLCKDSSILSIPLPSIVIINASLKLLVKNALAA